MRQNLSFHHSYFLYLFSSGNNIRGIILGDPCCLVTFKYIPWFCNYFILFDFLFEIQYIQQIQANIFAIQSMKVKMLNCRHRTWQDLFCFFTHYFVSVWATLLLNMQWLYVLCLYSSTSPGMSRPSQLLAVCKIMWSQMDDLLHKLLCMQLLV